MEATLAKLWSDDSGFIITLELILVATIVGIGSIVGLTCLRNAINSKLADVADNIANSEASPELIAKRQEERENADTRVAFSSPPIDEI